MTAIVTRAISWLCVILGCGPPVKVFTSSGAYTKPANIEFCTVEITGGGGSQSQLPGVGLGGGTIQEFKS